MEQSHGQFRKTRHHDFGPEFLRSDGGDTAIEYAVTASGIAIAVAATIMTLGSNVRGFYSSVATAMK